MGLLDQGTCVELPLGPPRSVAGTSETSISPAVNDYLDTRFAEARDEYAELMATPQPYGGAYSDVLRSRLIRDTLAEMRLGTGHRDRSVASITHAGERLTVHTDDVIRYVGSHPETYKTFRSRVERWCGTKIWMDANRHRWSHLTTIPGHDEDNRLLTPQQLAAE